MQITRRHVMAARGLLEMTQAQLAEAADLPVSVVRRFEAGITKPHQSTLEALQKALERRGIEFSNGGEPGVKLRPSRAVIPPL